jgi:hypothetical protein
VLWTPTTLPTPEGDGCFAARYQAASGAQSYSRFAATCKPRSGVFLKLLAATERVSMLLLVIGRSAVKLDPTSI